MVEKTLEVSTQDGTMPTFVTHPESGAPFPVVILFMDVFGIRDELKDMCRRLTENGYYTMLPSLFYRAGNPAYDPADFGPGGTPPVDESDPLFPMTLNEKTTNAMVLRDTGALLRSLEGDANAQAVGTIGTCMGGRHAMLAAAEYPDQVLAFASIHGGKLFSDQSDSPHLAIPKLKAEGYFGWAGNDVAAPEEHLEYYQSELLRCGVPHHIDYVIDACHGYFFPERHVYHWETAEKSWRYVLEMFARHLK